MAETGEPGTRLSRRLGFPGAFVMGLGSMVGTGVFVVMAPAASLAGKGLPLAILVAAAVAGANATSAARLAVATPLSGGTYAYGREHLGGSWGFLAGWCFIVAKTASVVAAALTFGIYLAPEAARPLGVAAVAVVVLIDYRGITKTALAQGVLLALVLGALASMVAAVGASGGTLLPPRGIEGGTFAGVAGAAGMLFFAFAGYARIATLGEEVLRPRRTIPRAMAASLLAATALYLVVGGAAQSALGSALGASEAPLRDAVAAVGARSVEPVVAAGAVVATLSVIVSLVAGIGRTVFAMAADEELPSGLGVVHPQTKVPHRALVAVGIAASLLVLVVPVVAAVGFSAFTILAYYALTNAAALRLGGSLSIVSGLGFLGCLALALALPFSSLIPGAAAVAFGAGWWWLRHR